MKYTSIPLYLGELVDTRFSAFHPGFPINILVALLEYAIALLILAIFYLIIPVLILELHWKYLLGLILHV